MTATPADLARIVTAPWRTGWVFRVLPDHRVEAVDRCGKVFRSKQMSDAHVALLYARSYAARLDGQVVIYGCGGCGPLPGPYRCAQCKELDVLADRAIEATL